MKHSDGKTTNSVQSFSPNNYMSGFSIYNSEGNVEYKREVERMVYELKQELYPVSVPTEENVLPVSPKEKAKKKVSAGNKKRKFPLVLILLFNLLALVVVAVACFDVGKIGCMIAPFYKETPVATVSVSILDGLFAELSGLGLGIGSQLEYSMHTDTVSTAALIAFAVFGTVTTLLALWQVIAAIVALAAKNENKRVRFGVRAFIMLLSLVAVLLSVIMLKAEFGFGDFCSLLFPKIMEQYVPSTWGATQYGLPRVDENYVLYSGYGLYALILIPLITMILSACSYKRKK